MIDKNLKNKSREEWLKLLGEKTAELRKWRFGVAQAKTPKVSLGRILRREIAQILTLLSNKPR